MVLVCCRFPCGSFCRMVTNTIEIWTAGSFWFLSVVFKPKTLFLCGKQGRKLPLLIWLLLLVILWHIYTLYTKSCFLYVPDRNKWEIVMLCFLNQKLLLKVCNVRFIITLNFSLPCSTEFLFVSFTTSTPPTVFSSVKPRGALMCFTAMTWSTSCSITTLWSPWWLRTSLPTWKPWGSSPKVHCQGQKCAPVLVRQFNFLSYSCWIRDVHCLRSDWLYVCFYRRTSWVWPPDGQARKPLQSCPGSTGTTQLPEVQDHHKHLALKYIKWTRVL